MSTIETDKQDSTLKVKVYDHFNLRTKNMVTGRLTDDIDTLSIDLSACTLLDSEAVIFMFQWLKSGKKLELNQPPALLFKILRILELEKTWNKLYTQNKEG